MNPKNRKKFTNKKNYFIGLCVLNNSNLIKNKNRI